MSPAICRLTARRTEDAFEGGTYRCLALDEYMRSLDAAVIESWPKIQRRPSWALRPGVINVILELERQRPETVLVSYPLLFPFLYPTRKEMTRALFLVYYLGHARKRYIQRLITDVGDLLLWEGACEPRWNPVKKSLLALERVLLGRCSTEVWAASHAFASHLHGLYPQLRVKVVPNGFFGGRVEVLAAQPPNRSQEVVRFVYAGNLSPELGAQSMIEQFISADTQTQKELVLLGMGGEWIQARYPHEGVVWLGTPGIEATIQEVNRCEVALLPNPDHYYLNLTFPTKLGLFLGCGLPIICTPYGEAGAFVASHQAGIVARLEDFGSAIKVLSEDSSLRDQLTRSVAKIRSDYDWRTILDAAFSEN